MVLGFLDGFDQYLETKNAQIDTYAALRKVILPTSFSAELAGKLEQQRQSIEKSSQNDLAQNFQSIKKSKLSDEQKNWVKRFHEARSGKKAGKLWFLLELFVAASFSQ